MSACVLLPAPEVRTCTCPPTGLSHTHPQRAPYHVAQNLMSPHPRAVPGASWAWGPAPLSRWPSPFWGDGYIRHCPSLAPQGGLSRVLLGLGAPSAEPWAFSALAKLPPGTYRLAAGVVG